MSDIGKSLIQGVEEALEYVNGQTEGFVAHKINVPAEIDRRFLMSSLFNCQLHNAC